MRDTIKHNEVLFEINAEEEKILSACLDTFLKFVFGWSVSDHSVGWLLVV